MKKIATTILRNLGRVLGVLTLCSFATVGTAFAGTITKTFEFGPGKEYTRSNVRTFPVLCRKAEAVTVKFQILGATSASNLVPITIELREPDTAPGQEGPLVVAKNATAVITEQTVTLSGAAGINRGCSLPWRVRVEHANAGAAPFVTFGSIKVDFDSAVRNIHEPEGHNLGYPGHGSDSVTVNIGSSGGREEGTIVLQGDWRHLIYFGGPISYGPNPIKLKFALIDPNGTVVKTAEGYANRQAEINQGLPILKLIYRVTNCTPGQWKVKITNLDQNDDVRINTIDEAFTPACP